MSAQVRIQQTHKILVLFTLCLLVSSCANISLSLVNHMAKNHGYTVHTNIAYGSHALNKLDIYMPQNVAHNNKTLPVVVFFHGGCWGACQKFKKSSYLFVGQALAARGYIVIIPNYRSYPEVRFNTIIRDNARSVEWVKNNIKRFGGNSDNIFLSGHSAGGHLAATLSYDRRYLKKTTWRSIRGIIGMAGAYDFYPFDKKYQYKVFAPAKNYKDSQPINFVKGGEAPTLLLYGSSDYTVKPRNVINLTKRITNTGGIAEVRIYNDVSHVGLLASLSRPFQKKRKVLDDIQYFINKYASAASHKKLDSR